ncbi:MAG: hypothetical protein WCG48_00895 [Candidatus Berkelbacteria bacterium]
MNSRYLIVTVMAVLAVLGLSTAANASWFSEGLGKLGIGGGGLSASLITQKTEIVKAGSVILSSTSSAPKGQDETVNSGGFLSSPKDPQNFPETRYMRVDLIPLGIDQERVRALQFTMDGEGKVRGEQRKGKDTLQVVLEDAAMSMDENGRLVIDTSLLAYGQHWLDGSVTHTQSKEETTVVWVFKFVKHLARTDQSFFTFMLTDPSRYLDGISLAYEGRTFLQASPACRMIARVQYYEREAPSLKLVKPYPSSVTLVDALMRERKGIELPLTVAAPVPVPTASTPSQPTTVVCELTGLPVGSTYRAQWLSGSNWMSFPDAGGSAIDGSYSWNQDRFLFKETVGERISVRFVLRLGQDGGETVLGPFTITVADGIVVRIDVTSRTEGGVR